VLPRSLSAQAVQELPAAIRADYLQAFGSALHSVYLIAACVMVLAFVLSLLQKDAVLKK
ncbi:EmrB/QacA family drug resistance transporter, partial [Mesorhizobium sp. M6A.T.Ce.TU.016.01.1.1]